jgi:hypothetical protein
MVVRNEADVIEWTLRAAARRFDHVHVYDTGSEDDTWGVVTRLAAEHPAIAPLETRARPFGNHIRAEIFAELSGRRSRGDWWAKLDADEIYAEDPWAFLCRVPPEYDTVEGTFFQFRFTTADLARWEEEPARYAASVPVTERLRWYLNDSTEARFVRDDGGDLFASGHPQGRATWPLRIWIRHYQYRSPDQIARRLRDRIAAARGGKAFRHEVRGRDPADWDAISWRDRVADTEGLDHDRGDGRLVPRPGLLRPVAPPPLSTELALLRGRLGGHLAARRRR